MASNKNEELELETESEVDAGTPRVYELGFHIDPELSQEDVKQVFQAVKGAAAAAGTVVATGEPEKIALAYTISRMEHAGRHDFSSAYFAWVAYETTATGHEQVLETVRAESRIFRSIDLLTTKEAAEHAAEQRELRMRMAEKAEDASEEVSDEQLDAALEEATA